MRSDSARKEDVAVGSLARQTCLDTITKRDTDDNCRGTTTAVFLMPHTMGEHHRSRQGGGRVDYHKAVAVSC